MSGSQVQFHRLSLSRVSGLTGQDVRSVTVVEASGRGVETVDDLSACVDLRRLNLARNSIDDLTGIADCGDLHWLDVSENKLSSLGFVSSLRKLTVLKASKNELSCVDAVRKLKELKALVLNENALTTLPNLPKLSHLNTLVLSHNKLKAVPVLPPSLIKLSLSYNSLRSVPDIEGCHLLTELRLNSNKIRSVPDTVQRHQLLRLLDLGNNRIKHISDVTSIRHLKKLRNLNLHGNAACDEEDYQDKICGFVDHLLILDGKRLLMKRSHKEGKVCDKVSDEAMTEVLAGDRLPEKKRKRKKKLKQGEENKQSELTVRGRRQGLSSMPSRKKPSQKLFLQQSNEAVCFTTPVSTTSQKRKDISSSASQKKKIKLESKSSSSLLDVEEQDSQASVEACHLLTEEGADNSSSVVKKRKRKMEATSPSLLEVEEGASQASRETRVLLTGKEEGIPKKRKKLMRGSDPSSSLLVKVKGRHSKSDSIADRSKVSEMLLDVRKKTKKHFNEDVDDSSVAEGLLDKKAVKRRQRELSREDEEESFSLAKKKGEEESGQDGAPSVGHAQSGVRALRMVATKRTAFGTDKLFSAGEMSSW